MRILSIFLFSLILISCEDALRSPGKPLMQFDFNNEIVNKGMGKLDIEGDAMVSYYYGEKDTCLDLMASAKYRKPIIINYQDDFSFEDYDGYTVSVWIQKARNDNESYSVLSQQTYLDGKWLGWELRAENCGSWSWVYRDSIQTWKYQPTSLRQPVNDGNWHQLTYSYNKNSQEARLYYDGENVAVYSLFGNTFSIKSVPLRVGVSPASASENIDIFNGRIDNLAVWSRTLESEEVHTVYRLKEKKKFKRPVSGDVFKVLTWNIWQGAIHEGKRVGAERILDVLQSSEADLIMLQEMAGEGPYLADGLGFYLYQRNKDLGVLSRYPLEEANNVFRVHNSGCIKVDLGADQKVFACPISLTEEPRLDSYIKSGNADVDTIIYRENEFRGREITFILGELRHLMFTNKNTPMILGGGFNSGSHLDWTERNQDLHMGLVVEYPVTKQVEKAGFTDTYRSSHPDEVVDKGYTWSTKFKSAFPNRTDFIYSFGEDIHIEESYVLDDHQVSFPSSHAAVVTVFNLEKK
ncbi:LamG-like jellyroll fold domain-containing protein [Carboxylicivirga linearis]|uniref:Endonuclease/exonuclease/phosphatase family protein n=1 Tax=Carboxylicivirga linearis TaxID=1628157 RepID=A0ABS5JSU4_9BACT|nr:LamG-like jellyroll fold domain-containing protein [Carboxylicivirga linearis]MBS2097979.1 endonuclease/exonuclease/phosphatase family protein [Carboxylicivirga linearis]